jgi:hypothetical protein
MDIKESFTKILKPKEENKSSLMLPDVSAEIIKPLPIKFAGSGEVKGYDFTLICKTKWGFCYEVKLDGIKPHYEVFIRKINKRFRCESYPTSKAFGIWAWTFKTKDKAIRKLYSF